MKYNVVIHIRFLRQKDNITIIKITITDLLRYPAEWGN